MWPLLPNLHYQSCATGWGVTVTSLSYNEDATKRHSSCPPKSSPLRHDILARAGKWLGCVIHWGGRSINVHSNMGRHIDPTQERAPPLRPSFLLPPAGYDMLLKVERSLRNIIMMFVTANDSARVEDKRGTSDFVANGAEEWHREEVVVAAGVVGWGWRKRGAWLVHWTTRHWQWERCVLEGKIPADILLVRTSVNDTMLSAWQTSLSCHWMAHQRIGLLFLTGMDPGFLCPATGNVKRVLFCFLFGHSCWSVYRSAQDKTPKHHFHLIFITTDSLFDPIQSQTHTWKKSSLGAVLWDLWLDLTTS